MHLRDQLALGVTPSKVPHLDGIPVDADRAISEVWLLPHWLDLANVEVLAADNTRVPAVHADGSGPTKSWIAMMFQTVDLYNITM
ncbi:CFF_collapsed_G0035330.mRNA.1.CDS.1 [Saccharomyces cerevisiae]|nr:CFF_collapsed_G0035330.mRNA.1.CDS.1 [Saccharomyces cerevisiae]